MSDTQDEDARLEESEPKGISWFIVSFLSLCLFMTGAMAYYVWDVFTSAV